jgi:hypothetical protein
MPDPNPYESPKREQPFKPAQIVKRGLGLGAILLLTPVAVAVAALISCGATSIFVGSTLSKDGSNYGFVAVLGWIIFLVPPLLAFFGMLWLAGQGNETDLEREKKNPGQNDRG